MHNDIKEYCRSCLDCQRAKISRHTALCPSQIIAPEERFRHVHINIVGPLPLSGGYRYCLTMMDRFSRCPEAVPLKDIEALTIFRAFVSTWVSRFGTPETVSTDQGVQFESQLFKAPLQLTGTHRIQTTPYHPAANGLIERWHRTFKAAIKCHANAEWTCALSIVLLGLRTNVLDSGASPAEYVYGTTLRVPGEFVLPDDFAQDKPFFLDEFRENIKMIKPVPVEHRHKKKFFFLQKFSNLLPCFLKKHFDY